jgi:hypothetical protein
MNLDPGGRKATKADLICLYRARLLLSKFKNPLTTPNMSGIPLD